jgi:ATP synthase protein I
MDPDLNDLDKKLEEASRKHQPTPEQARNAENISTGMRAGTELVGSIVVGGAIGYFLDEWLGSKPLFLIIRL